MKTILALVILSLVACRSSREINVELVTAQVIRIDTIFKNTDEPKQQLTWRDSDNIEYICIVSMNQSYPLGVKYKLLRPRWYKEIARRFLLYGCLAIKRAYQNARFGLPCTNFTALCTGQTKNTCRVSPIWITCTMLFNVAYRFFGKACYLRM